jgi:ankyrin repeat protein
MKTLVEFRNGDNALMWASYNGQINLVTLLLEADTDPNIQNDDGDTALMYASLNGHIEVIRALLKHGADPNIKNNIGDTALLISPTWNENIDVVRALLEAGASVSVKNEREETALTIAQKYYRTRSYKKITRMLTRHIFLVPFYKRTFTRINKDIIRETKKYLV